MIQLGQITFDDRKGQISLELTSLVEDNFTQQEDNRITVLWEELAAIIESALSRVE